MKTYFRVDHCPECGKSNDCLEPTCPHCGHQDEEKRSIKGFEHQCVLAWPFQLTLFLVGFLGQMILGVIVSVIVRTIYVSTHPGYTPEELQNYLSSVDTQFLLNSIIYVIVFVALLLILGFRKKLPALFKSFAKWQAPVFGLVGFLAIFAAGMVYSLIVNAIFTATGTPLPGVNANESSLRAMIAAWPLPCLLVFGLIGPFCEEVGYRVGLFGFMSRLGKPLAYILSALVFGFIHFDWGCFGQGSAAIIREVTNINVYIGSGAALCYIYDRFGFGASFTAHALNNLVSIGINIATGGKGA